MRCYGTNVICAGLLLAASPAGAIPPAHDNAPRAQAKAPRKIALSILADGKVRLNDGPTLTEAEFRRAMQELMKETPRPDLRIVPDRKAPFPAVAHILADLQEISYGPLGFTGTEK